MHQQTGFKARPRAQGPVPNSVGSQPTGFLAHPCAVNASTWVLLMHLHVCCMPQQTGFRAKHLVRGWESEDPAPSTLWGGERVRIPRQAPCGMVGK